MQKLYMLYFTFIYAKTMFAVLKYKILSIAYKSILFINNLDVICPTLCFFVLE